MRDGNCSLTCTTTMLLLGCGETSFAQQSGSLLDVTIRFGDRLNAPACTEAFGRVY